MTCIAKILTSITDQAVLDKECYYHGIYHQYCVERASAHLAHVFTVVSDVTAAEAQQLLKKKPDLVTPNGLNIKNQLMKERELLKEKKRNRAIIDKFVKRHFCLVKPIDDKTFYFFIAGRYEFCNKGADIFIESLARLNYLLQIEDPDVTVVAFFIFPTHTDGWNDQTLLRHTGKANPNSRKSTAETRNVSVKCSAESTGNDSLDGLKTTVETDGRKKVAPAGDVGVDGWESI